MKIIQRDIVSALIISQDNKILLGRKDPNIGGVYIDCWHIPGGGTNEGEDKLSALRREIMEEVGIDIAKYQAKLVDDNGSDTVEKRDKQSGEMILVEMNFNVYEVKITDKKSDEIIIHLSDDLYECKWIAMQDLSSVKHTPPSIKLFRRLKYL